MPIATYLKYKYTSIHLPEMANLVKRSTFNQTTPDQSPSNSVLEVTQEDAEAVIARNYGSIEKRQRQFKFLCIIAVPICLYSVFVFVLQVS